MNPKLILALAMTAFAAAHAEKPCAHDPQPTAIEATYAVRVHTFLLHKGVANDTHFLCGSEQTLFIGKMLMTEKLARDLAKSIGLATAKVSGYARVWFSDERVEGGEDFSQVWEYDLKTGKVRHGVRAAGGNQPIDWH